MDTLWGLTFAIISMICNGSFSSFNKLRTVEATRVNPQVFNLYFILGVILSSVLVYAGLLIAGDTVSFTYLGVISGFCLAIAGVTTFAAIKYIGLTVGVTIWSGTAILTSFVEGFLAGTTAEELGIAIVGCIVLIIGVLGVGFSEQIIALCRGQTSKEIEEQRQALISEAGDSMSGVAVGSGTAATLGVDGVSDSETMSNLFLGGFFAVMTGIVGGSVGFPSNWTSDEDNDSRLKFLISFAVGCCCIIPITMIWACFVSEERVKWHWKTCLVPGLLAGLVWNIGNVASLYAIQSIGYGVAYPIMQSSLIVANLWGIFVWKEVTEKRVICLIVTFGLIVMAGCGLITVGIIGA